MRILIAMNLPYEPALGGANKANRILAEMLAARGHNVRVVAPALGVPSRITLQDLDRKIRDQKLPFARGKDILALEIKRVAVRLVADQAQLRAALSREIASFRPSCVVISSEEPSQSMLEVALQRASCVAYLLHTPNFLPFGPCAFYPGSRRAELLQRVNAIIAVSQSGADYVREWGGLNATVCYLPVYGSPPFPKLPETEKHFITIVNPCRYKGIDIFVGLAKAFPEMMFAAVPTWGTTSRDLKLLGSCSNIHLLEANMNFEIILRETRVLLVPSVWFENFGLSVVEAMLRGIPVLASNAGGIPEAKLGTWGIVPVLPISRFRDELDENQLPVAEIPDQDLTPWKDAVLELCQNRDRYERESQAAYEAANRFVSSLDITCFEAALGRAVAHSGSVPN